MKESRRRFLASVSAMMTAAAVSPALMTQSVSASPLPRKELRFKDGKFNILQLTDLHLHFGEDSTLANQTLETVRKLLAKTRPDMVIMTGDLITAEPEGLAGGVEEAWAKLGEPFAEAQVPFATTYGNHDHERKESPAEMLAMIQKNPWSLTQSDDPSLPGAGNCVLSVKASDGSDKDAWNLWLFDSHSYPAFKCGAYDWIKFEQIAWYRKRSKELAAGLGRPNPALAFFHIPLPEYWILHDSKEVTGGINEPVCSPEINTGLFAAFKESGNVLGVFAGHDHTNDYIGVHQGIALAYGRQTGADSYGNLADGGRLITLHENERVFETKIVTPDEDLYDYRFEANE